MFLEIIKSDVLDIIKFDVLDIIKFDVLTTWMCPSRITYVQMCGHWYR
jgi:hypothetical protein